jgi:hypothetical protein
MATGIQKGTIPRRAGPRPALPIFAAAGCIAVAVLFACPVFVSAQTRAAGKVPAPKEPRAILVRGTESVKGLPGFAANAFEAIYGEYRLEASGATVQVWATREALYFDPAAWTKRVGGYAPQRRTDADGSVILAAEPSVPGWTAIAVFPPNGVAATEMDLFFRLFLDRFSHFLVGAKVPTDASFPATIEG